MDAKLFLIWIISTLVGALVGTIIVLALFKYN